MSHSRRIAIVVAQYNEDITGALYEGAHQRLLELGVPAENLVTSDVPGAVELPLIAQQYAQTGQYDAIICLGAIIRGETDHYDYVAKMAADGCQQVSLAHNIPVVFGVLTVNHHVQALDRVGGRVGHKGVEAAECAITMINTMAQINKEHEPAYASE